MQKDYIFELAEKMVRKYKTRDPVKLLKYMHVDVRETDKRNINCSLTQCVEYDVAFHFHQTGSNFRRGRQTYRIERKDQTEQAAKAGIDYTPPHK